MPRGWKFIRVKLVLLSFLLLVIGCGSKATKEDLYLLSLNHAKVEATKDPNSILDIQATIGDRLEQDGVWAMYHATDVVAQAFIVRSRTRLTYGADYELQGICKLPENSKLAASLHEPVFEAATSSVQGGVPWMLYLGIIVGTALIGFLAVPLTRPALRGLREQLHQKGHGLEDIIKPDPKTRHKPVPALSNEINPAPLAMGVWATGPVDPAKFIDLSFKRNKSSPAKEPIKGKVTTYQVHRTGSTPPPKILPESNIRIDFQLGFKDEGLSRAGSFILLCSEQETYALKSPDSKNQPTRERIGKPSVALSTVTPLEIVHDDIIRVGDMTFVFKVGEEHESRTP